MALINDLRQLLRSEFPGSKIKLTRFERGRVGGSLIWAGFDGQAQIDRQTLLGNVINSLPANERLQVSFILTLTPDELAAMTKS